MRSRSRSTAAAISTGAWRAPVQASTGWHPSLRRSQLSSVGNCSAVSTRPPPNSSNDRGCRLRHQARRFALLHLPREDIAHLAERKEMGVDQRQHAVLVHFAKLVAAEVPNLLFVGHS